MTARRGLAVLLPGRLVGEHQPRLARERAGEPGALRLPARDLLGELVGEIPDVERIEQVGAGAGASALGRAVQEQREGHVLGHGERRQQARTLERHGDRAGPQRLAVPSAGQTIDPPVGWSSPAIRCSSVDFPLPDGPTSAIVFAGVDREGRIATAVDAPLRPRRRRGRAPAARTSGSAIGDAPVREPHDPVGGRGRARRCA